MAKQPKLYRTIIELEIVSEGKLGKAHPVHMMQSPGPVPYLFEGAESSEEMDPFIENMKIKKVVELSDKETKEIFPNAEDEAD